MKQAVRSAARFLFVGVGIVVLTSVTIDATDSLRGSQSALGIFARSVTEVNCPSGMTEVVYDDLHFCIDTYEASVGTECPVTDPETVQDTARNINTAACVPQTQAQTLPWRNVAVVQAEALCAKAGKRLPTPREWFVAALGTPGNLSTCNVNGAVALTGSFENCLSGQGTYDMVGNVWEFVAATVEDGMYGDLTLPPSGYVSTVAESGIATHTTSSPQVVYDDAYFWSRESGVSAMMRGGFYGSKEDSSVYATHAQIDQQFASVAIGFRCVQDR